MAALITRLGVGQPRQFSLRAWSIAAIGSVVTVGYFFLPSSASQDIVYVVVGALSTVAMAVGIRINRPASAAGWYLLMAGNAFSTAGDAIENILYGLILHRDVPLPCIADFFYLAAYPLIFTGVARVCRTRQQAGSRENYADAAIVAMAAMALSWHFVMGGDVRQAGVSALGKIVLLAYPLMDIAVLFVLAQSLLFGSSRLSAHRILTVALGFTLVADSAYDVLVQNGGYSTGNIIDAGWLLNYVLMAVAALHPSVGTSPDTGPNESVTRRRLPILGLAGFVAPGILLFASASGDRVDTGVIAATSIVVFALVSLRMSWLFQRVRAQGERARSDAAALAEALQAREQLELDLRHQAHHDPLTGLANRTLLYERLDYAMSAGSDSDRLIGLCFCDLDGFKTVNDSLGHGAGDEVLLTVSQRLTSMVREGDTVARLGGDEFAVLLAGVESAETAMRVADRIVAAMKEPIEVGDRQISLSVSVGLGFAEVRKSTEQLISEADVAMYEAKAKGKSQWRAFQADMQERSIERLELTNAFRGSLERGEFNVLYQPQFSLADGRLEGFEALVRWQHPTLGLVVPNRFIPLAEESGFIIPLGRWVLERACEQAAEWERATGAGLNMAVNISGRQLQDGQLVDDVRTALALSGLAPDRLVLEVTESILLAENEDNAEHLTALKAAGVRIALDDFGTGYSSLAYLRRLPFDVLKIDKSFVDPLNADLGPQRALVSTIIEYARVVGLRTVAEGVESQDQQACLATLGCDSAQGYLFSRPVDVATASCLVSGLGCPEPLI